MDQEKIAFTVKGRNESVKFVLKMLTVAEDADYAQRFVQIADKKGAAKAAAEYAIYRDSLADWSVEMPTVENGNGKAEPMGKGTPAEAVRAFFSEKVPSREWLAVTAVSAFRNSLFPSVSFHEASE